MPVYKIGDSCPNIHQAAWIAPSAIIIGNVVIGEGSTIWFNAVLRGDKAPITIGKYTNIQDGCIVHSDGDSVCIGDRCSIGHGAILHGCHLEDGALIGMKAIVLDGIRLGENCFVGAGSLVTKSHTGGSLLLGIPAVVKRDLSQEEIEKNRSYRADNYVAAGNYYRDFLEPIDQDRSLPNMSSC
jgi:carbonic anhydrase/acetyltransferase-like protein (isoleucine patch superfamily)